MVFASDRRRVRRGARPSRRAFLLAAVLGASLAIARVSADADSADASRDGDLTPAEDVESYDPTQHIEFGTEEAPQEWVRTSEDGMPIVPFEIIDVAASLAEKEGSAAGETKDKAKRQDYQDLAAPCTRRRRPSTASTGARTCTFDGACAAEIKSLCPAEEMDTTHVSNLKFTSVGGEAKANPENETTAATPPARAVALLASELTDEQKEALEHLTAADPPTCGRLPAFTALPLSEKDGEASSWRRSGAPPS